MGTENLRLEGLSQPDSRMGWHGRGVVKARSSEQVLSCGGGARPARGSQCISGLHPSGPHLSVRIDALLAPLLSVALGVEGQLVGAHLHLAWQQEPRSVGWDAQPIQVSEAGEGWGHRRGLPSLGLPGHADLAWPDSDLGEQGLDTSAAGQHPGPQAMSPHCPEGIPEKRRERTFPSSMGSNHFISGTKTFHIFSMHKCAYLQT